MPPQSTVKDRSADYQAFTVWQMLNVVHITMDRYIGCSGKIAGPGIVSGVFRIWKMQVRWVHGAGP
jgi:hypothetical protein